MIRKALLLIVFFLFIPLPAFAVGEFKAEYDVLYSISETGKTSVRQSVTLTNLRSNLYAKQYSILIDSEKIKNVTATDGLGSIHPDVALKDGRTEILLTFNEQIVGLGNHLKFTLYYENEEITSRNGRIWEINIPGVVDDPDITAYFVSLEVPKSFGSPAYLTPQPAQGGRWNKDQLIKGGISAAYGSEQVFQLDISYHLINPKAYTVTTELALPPDTPYQRVAILSLEPKPQNVIRDAEGNWLARYDLNAKEELDITAKLAVGISLNPRGNFPVQYVQESEYLKSTQYWASADENIAELAKKYKTPRDIYNYVVDTLSYDYERINNDPVRRGAIQALATPDNAVCMEFTDLFIAIARAAGIPARENVGYAYTTNAKLRPLSLVADVLHAWPEYFDKEKNLWIPIDPTWANTTGGVNYFDKLDFNHIVFAIHGVKDDYPYPAGSYRREGQTTKDIEVTFGNDASVFSLQEPPPTVKIDIPEKLASGLTTKGNVVITNTGTRSIPEVNVLLSGSPFQLNLEKKEFIVPPYGTMTIPFSVHITNYLSTERGRIQATVNDTVYTVRVHAQPPYWIGIFAIGGILILGAVIWILARQIALIKSANR